MPFGDEKVTQFSSFLPTSVSYLNTLLICFHAVKYLAKNLHSKLRNRGNLTNRYQPGEKEDNVYLLFI